MTEKAACSSRRRVGQRGDQLARDTERAVDARRLDAHRLERALPADAARGRGVEASLQPLAARAGASSSIALRCEIVGQAAPRGPSEPFREREPECQLLVVAGRAHRDGDRHARDADLERLLDRDDVVSRAARDAHDLDSRCGVRRRLHRPIMLAPP